MLDLDRIELTCQLRSLWGAWLVECIDRILDDVEVALRGAADVQKVQLCIHSNLDIAFECDHGTWGRRTATTKHSTEQVTCTFANGISDDARDKITASCTAL